ncbi:hypothetical protein [Vibrio palustris]|uniref:Uncharacterized protein n=1 Tax=Vibrio palustris TaxID=1918946 RepID=A0A1R4B1Z8_9VIBR|nr:hypothetical protein [Vibrio palustris]SJL82942.1 hypothetical protein VPAL9027_00884 [Vibrio palustris]
MLHSLLLVLPPMLLGAQLILTLVLVKGDICPGQRGRIHKVLPAIGVLWLASATVQLGSLLVAGGIFYFYSKVQTKKTRKEGPLWVLHATSAYALVLLLWNALQLPLWSVGVSSILNVVLLGAMFAHLLLTLARTRLQAFHRILPVAGILAAMAVVLCVVPYALQIPQQSVAQATHHILTYFALLVLAIIIWAWHIFTAKTVMKTQLAVAQVVLLISMTGFEHVYLSTL